MLRKAVQMQKRLKFISNMSQIYPKSISKRTQKRLKFILYSSQLCINSVILRYLQFIFFYLSSGMQPPTAVLIFKLESLQVAKIEITWANFEEMFLYVI